MKKYEYEIFTYKLTDSKISWVEWLNDRGEDGWLLQSVDQIQGYTMCVFSREKVEQ